MVCKIIQLINGGDWMYSYDEFVNDLLHGREIEFSYKNKKYITLTSENGYCLVCDKKRVSEFYQDNRDFVRFMETYLFDGVSAKELFDNTLYDEKTLYIL